MLRNDFIKEKINLTYLEWDKTRESSGTAGSLLKSFEIKDNKKIYYKLSNYDKVFGITGMESINELIVSRLLNVLGVYHLEYQLIHADVSINNNIYETYLCASEDFKEKEDCKITLEDIYDIEKNENESIMEFIEGMMWADYFYQMIVIDFLIINRDRHGANIEIIRKRNGRVDPAPLFDHGLSLLFSCTDEKEVNSFDPMAELKVQSFVGSNSLFYNLELIPEDKMPVFRRLDIKDKDYILKDLNECLSESYLNKIWEIIWERWNYYENLRNHK